jgi:organic radical activating enzyme
MLARGWRVSIETNGTNQCEVITLLNEHPNGHVTVSPKRLRGGVTGTAHIKVRSGADLKVVLPQFSTAEMDDMGEWKFENRFIQPLDCADLGEAAFPDCIAEARRIGWRISTQTHKFMGLP